jgi:hypothetical protein
MLAECGHCGRTQEVDGESEGLAWYARHIIEEHPDKKNDPAVREHLRRMTEHVAPTNGRPI